MIDAAPFLLKRTICPHNPPRFSIYMYCQIKWSIDRHFWWWKSRHTDEKRNVPNKGEPVGMKKKYQCVLFILANQAKILLPCRSVRTMGRNYLHQTIGVENYVSAHCWPFDRVQYRFKGRSGMSRVFVLRLLCFWWDCYSSNTFERAEWMLFQNNWCC